MMNNYNSLFNSPRSQNALDILPHSQQRDSGIQLDLTHLASQTQSDSLHGNILQQQQGQGSSRMQQQQQLLLRQQLSTPPMHSQQQQQQQQQSMPKKAKESVLKTPLSLLNEICAKAKTLPQFMLEESGPVHSRVYSCAVKVNTQGFVCEATASGKTKKDAKQEAAKALLLQMDTQVEKFLLPKTVKEEPVSPVIEVDPEVPGNPVGDLNDLCTKLKRLPPEYEDAGEDGKPHERVYTVVCKLGSHIVESGRGRSKKSAKKASANRVHKRVLELLAKESESTELLKDDDNLLERLSSLTLVSKQDAKKMTDDWKLKDWIADLKDRSGPKLDLLKEPQQSRGLMTPDSMKLLKEIAEEQKFKLEFAELLDAGNSDLKTCVIAVSTGNQPITVLKGSADSKTQAKKMAAESFIDMMRLIVNSK